MGARLYDSGSGRFLSADPIIDNNDPQQLNGYAYSNNSPVTFSDPTGLLAGGQCGPDGILCGGGRENYQNEDDYNKVRDDFKDERQAQQQQSSTVRQHTQKAMQDAGISQAQYEEALKNAHKTKWDVIKEVAWEMLKDISGWNDIVGCFTKGDIWACGGLVMNLVPWGKVGKVIEAGYKAVKAVSSMATIISKAQGLLRRVEGIAAKAKEVALDALRKLGGKSDSAGGSCLLHSFVAGTGVLMADGSSKPIDQVQVGDKVKATNPATGKMSDRDVVGTIVHTDEGDMTRVTVDGGTVDATSWHPVWVEERGDFAKIGTLKVGERLRSVDGSRPVASSVEHYNQVQPVYDLTVDGVHTYHVVVGDTPILVHNCGTGGADVDQLTGRTDELQGLLHPTAQRFRTTSVMHAEGVEGGMDLAAVGARSNLSLMQRANALDAGELAISMSNGKHAEVKLLMAADYLELNPSAIVASRPFCANCREALKAAGATITGPRTAVWGG